MTLPWRKTHTTVDCGTIVTGYVFGPLVRIEQTLSATKHPHTKNYFIFNNKWYRNEACLIRAVNHAALVDKKREAVHTD